MYIDRNTGAVCTPPLPWSFDENENATVYDGHNQMSTDVSAANRTTLVTDIGDGNGIPLATFSSPSANGTQPGTQPISGLSLANSSGSSKREIEDHAGAVNVTTVSSLDIAGTANGQHNDETCQMVWTNFSIHSGESGRCFDSRWKHDE